MIDDQKLSSIRSDLPFLAKGVYVDNASISPISRRVQIASEQYNNIIAEQLRDARTIAQPHFEKGRVLAAKLVGSTAQNIAYVQNTSHGLSLVALGLDWRPGDNLVVCAQEFPSNYLCWMGLAAKGVEVRQISSPDGTLTPDHFRQAMDGRTRLVAVSHVQFYSGFRVDLASFRDLCSEYGALLIVDGTQSVGALKLDVEATGIDVLVASAHKWLMGPRGIGFASFSSRALEEITPAIVGWMSVNDPFDFKRTLDYLPDARRFESGTPNAAGIFGLAERLAEIDELGIEWIEDRVLQLNELLSERAFRQGILPVYRFERRSRSGIVLLKKPDIAASSMLAALNKDRIYASIRNGAIRVSMHYYNTIEEVERIICAMNSV